MAPGKSGLHAHGKGVTVFPSLAKYDFEVVAYFVLLPGAVGKERLMEGDSFSALLPVAVFLAGP